MKNEIKVLLVDPKAPSYGVNIALALLGTKLVSSGFIVKLLDQNNRILENTLADLRTTIKYFEPDIIGFSVLYITQKEVQKLTTEIRKTFKGHIIIGGPQVTLLGKDTFNSFKEINAAFVGEAEESIVAYCKQMIKKQKYPGTDIPGVIYSKDGEIFYIENAEKPLPIDNNLFPDFSLYDIREIERYPLLTSRGCPYACTYCFRTHRHDWRSRSPESIMSELETAVEKYKVKEVWIYDDSFNIDKHRVIEICRLWKSKFPDLKWACAGIRADHVTKETAFAMKDAGCSSVGVGIESLNNDVFKCLNKRETTKEVLRGISYLQRAGINVRGNFIIGLPGDTYKKTIDTFHKANKLKLKSQSWTILLPIPGTEIYEDIYSNPTVKRLNSYLDIDMIWMPEKTNVKCAFEFPEFSAKEKLKAYYKINTLLGFSFVRYPHRKFLRIIEAFILIFRYAPLHSPILVFRLFIKYFYRFITGNTVITSLNSGLRFDGEK